jgi:hypothetical protein
MTIDVRLHNEGTLIGIAPVSAAAETWIDEHVDAEGYMWMGPVLYVELRCAGAIINGMIDAGLIIER